MLNILIKRASAVSMVLVHLWPTIALAAEACPSTGGLGAVFSVLKDGKITFAGADKDRCAIKFYGASSVNVQKSNLTAPGTKGGQECNTYVTETGAPGKLGASGTVATGPTLVPFPDITKTTKVTVSKDDGIKVNGTLVTFDSAGVGSSGDITKVSNKFHFSGAEYESIQIENLNSGSGVVFTRPVRIKTFTFNQNCNGNFGVTFAQDVAGVADADKQTFINRLVWKDKCNLNVSGVGRTTVNILGKDSNGTNVGFTLGQSGSCLNYSPCPSAISERGWAEMDAQHPERLQINIYNGDAVATDWFSIAAGIYIPNGDLKITAASGVTVVGEVLAKNISNSQNNEPTQFFSKSTAEPQLRKGAYSLTPQLSEPITNKGSLVYRAMQNDYAADGKPGTSGHLRAFKLKDNSQQEETPEWDAATNMTVELRGKNLYTESGTDFQVLTLTSNKCVINPTSYDCRATNDPRDPTSLVGVPWRVAPILVGDSVLFATDDGILYSVNKTTGILNWGWIPSQILTLAPNVVGMATRHPWGQIGSMEVQEKDKNGVLSMNTYVVGTALGGQLHFSMQVSNYGAKLEKLVWSDYRPDKFSPGSAAAGWGGVAGRPYGGAAPVPSFQNNANKVAYVVGGGLVVRDVNIPSTSKVEPVSFLAAGTAEKGNGLLTALPTSNLLYVNDAEIYFGADDGKVYQSSVAGQVVGGDKSVGKVGLGSPAVWFVNGARTSSATGNGLMLMAQSERRVNMLRLRGGEWSLAWYTGLDESGLGESSGKAVEKISDLTTADHAFLSAPATIRNNTITLYYTTRASDCDTKAYTFGPLKLADGSSGISGAQFRLKDITSLSNYIGDGESTGGAYTRFNGKEGILVGSGGDGIKGGDTAVITVPGNAYKDRLNWRELTNFF